MTIHVLPLEKLDQRYTVQWADWFAQEFHEHNITARWYEPKSYPSVKRGQFLDVINTNKFKAEQLAMLCSAFDAGEIKANDVVFFFDLWFPGLEMLFYIRDGLGLDFKIAGILHAGTWDPFDFLTQQGMRSWAMPLEKLWFAECDLIFLATKFHKALLKPRLQLKNNISITGLPLRFTEIKPQPKENIIVFPHRLAPEKQPQLFDELAEELRSALPGWQFIKTQETPRTKAEYYDLLSRAKVAVSFAQQETWGIGMLEALFHRCIPIAPDRLAYPETMPEPSLYDTDTSIHGMVVDAALDYEQTWTPVMTAWRQKMIDYHSTAIVRMIVEMRQKGWKL